MNIDRPENPPAFDVPALENHNSFVCSDYSSHSSVTSMTHTLG